MNVLISTNGLEIRARLLDNPAANDLESRLPVEGRASRWGDEIYFACPLEAGSTVTKQTMDVGDIGYWFEGGALAIFFGPTPASTDERPRAAVPVALIGAVTGDATQLRRVGDGDLVRIESDDTGSPNN